MRGKTLSRIGRIILQFRQLFLASQSENWLNKKGEQSGAESDVRCFRVASFVVILKLVEAEKCWLSKFNLYIFLGEESLTDLPTPNDLKYFQTLAESPYLIALWMYRHYVFLHTLLQWFRMDTYRSRLYSGGIFLYLDLAITFFLISALIAAVYRGDERCLTFIFWRDVCLS